MYKLSMIGNDHESITWHEQKLNRGNTDLDLYLIKFVDMNVDVNPNVTYIYLWGGTH
jgi:hypothetical protein